VKRNKLIIVCFTLILIGSCQSNTQEPEPEEITLSELMRERLEDLRHAKESLIAGEPVSISLLSHFGDGVPSRDELTNEAFQNELKAFEALYASFEELDPKLIKERYQAVVQWCISCHERHCPGPLRAIRTLELEPSGGSDFKLFSN